MVSVFTPNIQLEEPARGDDVGTWDTPVNANMTLIDLVVGGTATIPLAGAPVVLAAAQFQAKTIVFNSTLTANVSITFPTSFTKSYEIYNQTTGSSNFVISLQSTAAGGAVICCPPGEMVEVANIAGSFVYKNLGRVGSYWDHGGSSVPHWVSACTVPPYLNCDATAFSSVTYPHLAVFLGGTTLPDSRGRARFALNQTTARVTAGISGVDGNTIASAGGSESLHAHTHVNTLTDPLHAHAPANGHLAFGTFQLGVGANTTTGGTNVQWTDTVTASAATGITINNVPAGVGAAQNVPPAYIGGITLIRAG